MRTAFQWHPNRIAEELPAMLFFAFNAVMAWLAWTLTADIAYWQGLLAAGDVSRVPHAEPHLSQSILTGVPTFWLIGAIFTGTLAGYWRMTDAGRPISRNGGPGRGH